jgi:hypothetical protein
LSKLVARFHSLLHEAVTEENKTRSTAEDVIRVEAKLIGDRPTGEMRKDAELVRTAAAVVREFGKQPGYRAVSTDANNRSVATP